MRIMLSRSAAAIALGALAFAGACKEATSVPDLNNLPSSTIAGGFTPTTFALLTTGLLNSDRGNLSFGYIVSGETMARDVYNLDPSENRYITEFLGGPPDPSGFGGGGSFIGLYSTVRTANTILDGINSLSTSLSADEIAAARGLVRTLKAQALYRVFALRGPNGVAIDVDRTIAETNKQPAPLLCQTSALAAISALLDSAYTDLQAPAASKTAFPFSLPAGFTSNGDFSTPAKFALFNRGLKGRVEVARGILGRAQSYTDAVTALNASFLNVTGDLTAGPYYTYSTAPNETVNPIAAVTIYLSPKLGDSVQAGDARASKIATVAKVSRFGVATTYKSPLASTSNLTGQIPILRNAELILLRAQANIGLNNLSAAAADINVVRTKEGGLPALGTPASADAAISAVLYEKRLSLLLTGAQRLVDLRSYGRLNATYFKPEISTDIFNSALPIPTAEANARSGNLTLTCST